MVRLIRIRGFVLQRSGGPSDDGAGGRGIVTNATLWLLLCGSLLATPPLSALDPTKAISQHSVRNWQAEDGLPQNSINAIAQRPDGYLWVGTQEGIARFDGVQFTTVANNRKPVSALLVARDGTFWTAGSDGLTRYQNGVTTRYGRAHGLKDEYVWSITEGSDGSIWAATYSGGISRFRNGVFTTYTTDDGLPSNAIWSVWMARDGSLWIGTNGGGLSRLRNGRFTNFSTRDGLPHDVVWAVYEDRKGTVWIGTNRGLCQYRNGKIVSVKTIDDVDTVSVKAFYEDREGAMWIGTGGRGLIRHWDGVFSRPRARDALADAEVLSFREDAEGSLWAGTSSSGLYQLRSGKFTMFGVPEGLISDEVWTLFEARDGAVWIGTNAGLSRLKDGKISNVPMNGGTSSAMIRSVFEARDGTIWFGTYAGAWRYHNGTMRRKAEGLSHEIARAVIQDRSGTIWIGTRGAGLNALRDGVVTVYDTSNGLVNDVVNNLVEDADGSIWIATHGGVSRFHRGTFTNYTEREGLSSPAVRSIYHDGATHWIGTYGGGLNRIRNGGIDVIREKDGLFDNVVHSVVDDLRGNLWMSSNRGIFHVSKRELNDFADGKIGSVHSVAYDAADGMRKSECNSGAPAAIRTRDGRLWFATMAGVAVIDPKRLPRNTTAPAVWNEMVLVDGKEVENPGAGLTVGTGRRTLEMRYTALSFVAPQKVAFRYRLRGFSEDWVAAGNRRTAFYTNLPPGDYTFEVMGSNNDGVWSTAGNPIPIHMQAAFFQRAWFWIACAACALIAIHLGVKMRLRMLEDRERLLATRVEEQTAQLSAAKETAEGAAEIITQLSRRKRLILDSAAEGIFGLDQDGVATFINPSAELLLGWSVEELAGRDLHSLIHSADGEPPRNREHCVICSSTLEPRTRIGRDDLFRRDGRSFPVDYTVSAIVDECGASEGVVVTFRDITEQRVMERMKDEFVSTVSHELRTPLTSIRGALGLLRSGMLGTVAPQGQRMLDIAVDNTDRLVRLINDILDQERIESGRLELVLREANPHDLMTVAVDGVRAVADQAGIEVVVEPAEEIVNVDCDRIIQTLTNLVSNAIKFSPAGTRVTVGGETRDHEFVFRVVDQGRGIPADMLETIFERFKQVDASDSRQKGGTGLGLSICRSIVQAHGGQIWAESGDTGSAFHFSIPHPANAADRGGDLLPQRAA